MKFIGWLSKTLFQTILVSTLTLFITLYMVNLYVDRLMGQLEIENTLPKIQISDVLSYFVNQDNLPNTEKESNSSLEEFINDHEKQNTEPETVQNEVLDDDFTDTQENDVDAVEVWNQQENSAGTEDMVSDEVLFTAEAFTQTKDLLSDEDKMIIFSLIISNLPQGQLQELSTMMEEGITLNELISIESIMKEHLDEVEYEQLLTILEKY
ncbi:hypothetical protein [Chengkuizengella sediminis]|uniref:hypothetical protein n=1 Tax=Chengkuizengella sediminis TaxID=1885917 RepID=UPI001389B6DA|nr:hypothetical protein [Chengkuizengella sediminis]NDI36923.1 hypothetical protein [Chengkuizengella sediminis]